MTENNPNRLRGFALMKERDPDRLKSISAKGGAAVDSEKRTFSTNRELAREAGRTGGQASRSGGRPRKK